MWCSYIHRFKLMQQLTALRATRQTLLEPSYDIAALMLGHRTEAEYLAGQHLMLNRAATQTHASVRGVAR